MLDVNRGCYYYWKAIQRTVVPDAELALLRRMKALFAETRTGQYKVCRLIKSLSLVVKYKRRFKATTDSNHKLPLAKNVLNRQFSPAAPERFWGADIAHVWTRQSSLYLAVVIDLYSRRVVGWARHKRMTKALVIRALNVAIAMRKPKPGLVVHSDRSSQYASKAHQKVLAAHSMICNMSRKGNFWDNAPVERFFRSLKQEWIGHHWYSMRHTAEADIREYMLMYYNTKRLHSTLGYLTPVDYGNSSNRCVRS